MTDDPEFLGDEDLEDEEFGESEIIFEFDVESLKPFEATDYLKRFFDLSSLLGDAGVYDATVVQVSNNEKGVILLWLLAKRTCTNLLRLIKKADEFRKLDPYEDRTTDHPSPEEASHLLAPEINTLHYAIAVGRHLSCCESCRSAFDYVNTVYLASYVDVDESGVAEETPEIDTATIRSLLQSVFSLKSEQQRN